MPIASKAQFRNVRPPAVKAARRAGGTLTLVMEDPMDSHVPEQKPPRPDLTVALIGPDGAGKTSITRRVTELLPVPSRLIYMGVNLESSTLMLPTTRLILTAKRAR